MLGSQCTPLNRYLFLWYNYEILLVSQLEGFTNIQIYSALLLFNLRHAFLQGQPAVLVDLHLQPLGSGAKSHRILAGNISSLSNHCSRLSGNSNLSPGVANADYLDAKTHYWDAANADLTPACVVFRTSTPNFPTLSKSYWSSQRFILLSRAEGTVRIHLASTNISSDNQTADAGPGARWENVISPLDPHGLAVVGGRVGDVGVGGLLLGGGLSFLSAQYGLACDNVMNYEVVLADSSIVNVNARSHTDLF
ncbi:putative FAD-linked oxidoreductase [Lachnellula suecica]|uniref:Putative FAD-linked oxidoreductase n=1 Tax=Lachnellula suecica TaxID=602035 RepID=A0A8T9CM59_9HELO|nr:putative FAD-linked oxidoreductase [Lachnellula suecica]